MIRRPRKVLSNLKELQVDKHNVEASPLTPSDLISDIITDIFNNISTMNTSQKSAEEVSNPVLNESVATLDDSIHTDEHGDPRPDGHQEQTTTISSTKSLN